MKQEEVISRLFDIIAEIAPDLDLNDVDPDIPLRDQLELDSVEFTTLNRCATYLAPKLEEGTA